MKAKIKRRVALILISIPTRLVWQVMGALVVSMISLWITWSAMISHGTLTQERAAALLPAFLIFAFVIYLPLIILGLIVIAFHAAKDEELAQIEAILNDPKNQP